MRYLYVFFGLFYVFISSCRRENQPGPIECVIPAIVPFQPYSNPVWHPNGNLLGFNHTPLAGVSTSGTAPCIWYTNSARSDSTGFYLMNKDGSGFRRVTNFYLTAPSWSPDGAWLAFSLGSNIYKMPFNATAFDTSQIIQLTTVGGNFYPNWTANSDSIYFDSNNDINTGNSFYTIWKMDKNGNGKSKVIQSSGSGDARQPYTTETKVYYITYFSGQPEACSIDKTGINQTQLTFTSKNGIRRLPKYYKGNLFFWDVSLFSTPVIRYTPVALAGSIGSYDISKNGEIVFPTAEYAITDIRFGTLWIMNADGNNKRQLTYNHY